MKKMYLIGILFSLFLWVGCPVVDPLHKVDYPVEEDDVLFYPMTNKLSPPANFEVDVSQKHPILTWTPNHKADYYRIYRKRTDAERFVIVDFGNRVRGESFEDLTIDKMVHSDTYEYRISSVDRFDREGFLSNPIVAVVSSPAFIETASIADASKGFFDSITVGSKVVVQQNKIGILLKVKKPENYQEGVNDVVAFRVLRRRTSSGDWGVLLPYFSPTANEAHSDPRTGTNVFYYVDVPPTQGEAYSYKIIPINVFGKLGRESESIEGYVYATPKIKEAYSMALDGYKPGAIDFEFFLPDKLSYVNFYVSKNEFGPYVSVPGRYEIDPSTKRLKELVRSSAVFAALGESGSTAAASYHFIVRGSYGLYSNPSGGQAFETINSVAYSAAVYNESLSILQNPNVKAIDGSKDPETGEIVNKITLKWQKAQTGVDSYAIYRSRLLNWENVNTDGTGWVFVEKYTVKSDTPNEITWTDNTADLSYGAYFYKVNPCAVAIEQQNDDSESAFAKATMALSKKIRVVATDQIHNDKVLLSWQELSGGGDPTLLYRIEQRKKASDPWELLVDQAELLPEAGTLSYLYPTTYVGSIEFRVTPLSCFKNKHTVLVVQEAGEAVLKTGARGLSDIEWTRLVMKSIYEAQALVTTGERDFSYTSGGGSVDKGSLQFKRRSYLNTFTSISNDKYDAYRFINHPGINGAITIAEGVVYHLYCTQNDKTKILEISFSSNVFSLDHGGSDDKIPKTQGELDIQGVYPGKIQLWFKNQGYVHRNDQWNVLPIDDYKPADFYTSAHDEWINWFSDSYGLKLRQDATPSINKDTAYAIKRAGASSYTKISFSEVGAFL